MRVKTLIKRLQKLNPDANIYVGDDSGVFFDGIRIESKVVDPDGVYVQKGDKLNWEKKDLKNGLVIRGVW